ncbi:unnamed protein product [Blepharisma stoltei]|uniref:Kelch motif family protein n=1 Tax=Blepharisma stoltei TaxID=1481888 RepID=A0AAU9J5C3_9CILI|nr:unnamed protein product [Blepharisma stoltei]
MELKTQKQLKLLNSQLNILAVEDLIYEASQTLPELQDLDSQLFNCQYLKAKTSEIWKRVNSPELELDFRRTCSLFESQNYNSDPFLAQAYKEYIEAYYQATSLYLFNYEKWDFETNAFIYNTKSEREIRTIFKKERLINWGTSTARLPNGGIFCFGKHEPTRGITMIVDSDLRFQVLPSGTPCYLSSAVYFDRSVYCFGGMYYNKPLTLSCRFDLDENRWIKLNPMPKADWLTHSVVFKGNILISGKENKNLLLYSMKINSFTTIPYEFPIDKRKILINIGRLYLIECFGGLIFESEIGDEYTWKQIATSIISQYSNQFYFSYNKGAIYIGILEDKGTNYYKFNLNEKIMIKL